MYYYHIRLDKEARDLCTIILPWGKYAYNVLLMGFIRSTDIFQHIMNIMFSNLPTVLCYFDDLIVLSSGEFKEHVGQLEEVFSRLSEKGFQVNPLKTFWAQLEVQYLSFIISRNSIQPQPKKIQGIEALTRPTNQKQLRGFIGRVNFYKEMWRHRAHILKPLSEKAGKGQKFVWTTKMEEAFVKMKSILSEDTFLAHLKFRKKYLSCTLMLAICRWEE